MPGDITLTELRGAAEVNLKCMKSLLDLLGESDTAAKLLRCNPGDPDCPRPKLDKRCMGYSDATVLKALEVIHHNFEIYLELLEQFQAPPIPLPEDPELAEGGASAGG